MRGPRHALQTDVAGIGAQVEELLSPALAIGDIAQLGPVHAIIRDAQRVLLAIGVLPGQLHIAHRRLAAEVELYPGAILESAGPAGVKLAIDGLRRRHAGVLQRRRCGHHWLDRLARLAHVNRHRIGRRHHRHHGRTGECLDLENRIAVGRRPLYAFHAQVATAAAQTGPVFRAALAVVHRLDGGPIAVVVRHLQQVLDGVGILPVDMHAVNHHRLAKVQRQKLVVQKTAAPAGVLVMVYRRGSAKVCALRRTGGGSHRSQDGFRASTGSSCHLQFAYLHRGLGDRVCAVVPATTGRQQGQHGRRRSPTCAFSHRSFPSVYDRFAKHANASAC